MDNFDKKLRIIKISRSPDAYLDEIFMKVEKFTNDRYKYSTFYKLNNELLFEIKYMTIIINHNIVEKLKRKYHCNDTDIINLLDNKVRKYFKLDNITSFKSWDFVIYNVLNTQLKEQINGL